MKKLMALVLVAMMCLALSVTAFAEGETGTITITPPTDAESDTTTTYKVYKIFDAVVNPTDNTKVSYKLCTGDTLSDAMIAAGFSVDAGGNVKGPDTLNTAAIEAIAAYVTEADVVDTVTTTGTATGVTDELDYGYYYITTTTGTVVTIDSNNNNPTVNDKNKIPTLDKEITGVNGETDTLGTGDDTSDPGNGVNEKAIAEVGDTVSYKITVVAQPGAENYIVTDTLSNGLTPPAASGVTANTGDGTYNVTVEGQVITVTFTKAYLDTISTETNIEITYDAVVNNSAVIGEAGNKNSAKLEYGHDPSDSSKPGHETPPDEPEVFVAKISVTKTDGTKGLAGATFVLKNSDNKFYKFDATATDPVTWVDTAEAATHYSSGSDGKLDGEFTGLSNGTYTLVETATPEGYNDLDPNDDSLKFTIEGTDYTDGNLIQSSTVVNQAGAELPSTGGIGTKIFYTMGAVLVIGAGVILVSRKRAGE